MDHDGAAAQTICDTRGEALDSLDAMHSRVESTGGDRGDCAVSGEQRQQCDYWSGDFGGSRMGAFVSWSIRRFSTFSVTVPLSHPSPRDARPFWSLAVRLTGPFASAGHDDRARLRGEASP